MKRQKQRIITTLGIAAAILIGAQIGTGDGMTSLYAQEDVIIEEGVYIGSISVGGMTAEEATNEVNAYMDTLLTTKFTLQGADGSIELTAEDMGVSMDVETAVTEALAVAHSGSLINRFKASEDLKKSDVVVPMNLGVDKQATAQKLYDKKAKLDIEVVDNGLKKEKSGFTFVAGKTGVEVDIVNSVYEINRYLNEDWDGTNNTIALLTNEVQPKGTQEELARVKDLMGTFSTNFKSSGSNRSKNVKNGCAKINGTVIYPGETLSVYECVSPFTAANGYELAGSYLNGTTVESYGGGICQVSTTLYNAAIRAELDIAMRFNHSMIVNYVDPSADAAIAGTYKDLRIVNNYENPIFIEGVCSGGIITFNIYGVETRTPGREVIFESETLSTEDLPIQFNLSSSYALGYYNVDQSAHQGIKSRLWKVVKENGKQVSRDIFNNSTYKASPKIVTIGTGGATAEQIAAIQNAINTGDEGAVKAAIAAAQTPVVPEEPVVPEVPDPIVPVPDAPF